MDLEGRTPSHQEFDTLSTQKVPFYTILNVCNFTNLDFACSLFFFTSKLIFPKWFRPILFRLIDLTVNRFQGNLIFILTSLKMHKILKEIIVQVFHDIIFFVFVSFVFFFLFFQLDRYRLNSFILRLTTSSFVCAFLCFEGEGDLLTFFES